MSNIELLSPAGDFECLVSAVQNGANAVYFGLDKFNARVNGRNFEDEELVKAIKYAKLRNVKTHLTLNILIKNKEFEEALKLVEFAYNSGIDAVIVQDLGLAKKIMELFPKLEVHSSTQMTIYNLDGVKEIEKLGYSRCVLARELSIEEIKNIVGKFNVYDVKEKKFHKARYKDIVILLRSIKDKGMILENVLKRKVEKDEKTSWHFEKYMVLYTSFRKQLI